MNFFIEYCVESKQKKDRFSFYIFNWEWHKIQLEMAYLDMHTNQQKKILAKINLRSKKQQTRSNKKKLIFSLWKLKMENSIQFCNICNSFWKGHVFGVKSLTQWKIYFLIAIEFNCCNYCNAFAVFSHGNSIVQFEYLKKSLGIAVVKFSYPGGEPENDAWQKKWCKQNLMNCKNFNMHFTRRNMICLSFAMNWINCNVTCCPYMDAVVATPWNAPWDMN